MCVGKHTHMLKTSTWIGMTWSAYCTLSPPALKHTHRHKHTNTHTHMFYPSPYTHKFNQNSMHYGWQCISNTNTSQSRDLMKWNKRHCHRTLDPVHLLSHTLMDTIYLQLWKVHSWQNFYQMFPIQWTNEASCNERQLKSFVCTHSWQLISRDQVQTEPLRQ